MRENKNNGVTRRDFIRGSAGTVLAASVMGAEWTRASESAHSSLAKVVRETNTGKAVSEGAWIVEKSTALRSLTIEEGTSLAALEGKTLTMTVDGIGTAIKPGTYKGDIIITVTDRFIMPLSGVGQMMKQKEFRSAILIEDGKYVPEKSVPAIVQGGKVADNETVGVSIMGSEESFNGIIIIGKSEYTIEGIKIDFEGDGANDFIGLGAGIICAGDSKVTVNNSTIRQMGVTRAAIDMGDNAVATFNDCRISNYSPATDKMYPTWMLGLRGTNRATQHRDSITVHYNNCYLSSNGWGVLSVEGGKRVRMYVKKSTIELIGPRARGYGAFSIGDCLVSYDDCTVNVQGYGVLMGHGTGICNTEITGGTIINSTLYGVLIYRDIGSELKVNKGTIINTHSSSFVVKGSNTYINVDKAKLNPANGIILQLMDNDVSDLVLRKFKPPVGEIDKPIPGRDFTVADPKEDVFMTISNMDVTGDFYNSTTNLKANCREKGSGSIADLPGMPEMVETADLPEDIQAIEIDWEAQQGVKNLDLKFVKTKVKGIISAAIATYKDGVTVIDVSNLQEISAVTQTAHEPVNNGVILYFDKNSVWTVTGTSYLTSLTVAKGAVIKAPEGKTVTMTVDGVKKAIAPGTYIGKIVIMVV
jgi:hypothetical protein